MDSMKYIIVKRFDHEVPVLFCHMLNHDSIAVSLGTVVSAGFFYVDFANEKVRVWGESKSLDKQARDGDAEIIKRELNRWKR